MTKYTHIVTHRIMGEHGKPTDQLDYCIDIQHAYAIAQQLMAVGAQGVAIVELKQPVSEPIPMTNSPDQLS